VLDGREIERHPHPSGGRHRDLTVVVETLYGGGASARGEPAGEDEEDEQEDPTWRQASADRRRGRAIHGKLRDS
jgi:hypothetical protein